MADSTAGPTDGSTGAEDTPDGGASGCFFCAIASGAAGVPLLVDGTDVVAFRDIDPQAPTHVLVIPKRHHRDVVALAASEPDALAELAEVAGRVAGEEGEGAFRLVFNTGEAAGQSVFHVHGHVLAGRSFHWPPG